MEAVIGRIKDSRLSFGRLEIQKRKWLLCKDCFRGKVKYNIHNAEMQVFAQYYFSI